MARHQTLGSSIEGKKVEITTRKHILNGYQKIKGKSYFKYLLSINANAEIKTAINPMPKIGTIWPNANFNQGDSVHGDGVDLYSCSKLNFTYISNHTNVHGIQGDTTKTFGSASIRKPFRFLLEEKKLLDC